MDSTLYSKPLEMVDSPSNQFCALIRGMFRVKKAIDLKSNKEVAIKILKLDQPEMSKKNMLESFFKEMEILSKCRHRNVVKLIDASFSGTLIKEAIPIRKTSVDYTVICQVDTN